jgi:hypothetical protein
MFLMHQTTRPGPKTYGPGPINQPKREYVDVDGFVHYAAVALAVRWMFRVDLWYGLSDQYPTGCGTDHGRAQPEPGARLRGTMTLLPAALPYG